MRLWYFVIPCAILHATPAFGGGPEQSVAPGVNEVEHLSQSFLSHGWPGVVLGVALLGAVCFLAWLKTSSGKRARADIPAIIRTAMAAGRRRDDDG